MAEPSVADRALHEAAHPLMRDGPATYYYDQEHLAAVHGRNIDLGTVAHLVGEGAFADARLQDGFLLARRAVFFLVPDPIVIELRVVLLHGRLGGAAFVHTDQHDRLAGHVIAT